MLINHKIFNLPPYISTAWTNVQGLHMRGETLVVNLTSGEIVEIRALTPDLIQMIFNAHRSYLESLASNPHPTVNTETSSQQNSNFDPRSVFQFGHSIEGLGTAMQHNASLANAPDLPVEFLEKISAIAKIIAPEEIAALPQAESHCNCPHCQIARAISGNLEMNHKIPEPPESDELIVSTEDLQFQQWKIEQTGEQLFEVTNKLEPSEKYHVFLGNPIGCTCGEPGCVHIPAVLKS